MLTSPVRKSRRLVYDFGFKMTIVVRWIAVAKKKGGPQLHFALCDVHARVELQSASNKNRLSIDVLFTPLQLRL